MIWGGVETNEWRLVVLPERRVRSRRAGGSGRVDGSVLRGGWPERGIFGCESEEEAGNGGGSSENTRGILNPCV